jgi:3-oxoacyl-[acyl-carrier protein] reductase
LIRLDGKVAIVTGAGRGLGRAYAVALARAGCAVIVNDVDGASASQVVDAIQRAGGRALAAIASVGGAEEADALVDFARSEYGRLDLMCTNAGVVRDRTLVNMSDADFDAVIQTHLRGTFTCGRAAVKVMREQPEGGSLILISSISGQLGNFGQTNYSAAKAGIAAMARTWALELARYGIRANALIPNALTQMVATIPGFDRLIEKAKAGETLPPEIRQGMWMGVPEDVSPMVVFLASDEARHVTGQCIAIGGDKIALWTHPTEKAVAFREGGWSAEAIAATWDTGVGATPEPFGIPFLARAPEA